MEERLADLFRLTFERNVRVAFEVRDDRQQGAAQVSRPGFVSLSKRQLIRS